MQQNIPKMHLNRNYPGAVLYGETEYGGLEFPEAYTLQDQTQFPYLLKQLRWDKVVANDFLCTLDAVQLKSGFVTPLLENTEGAIEYLGPSLMIDLRRRLHEIEGSLWIEEAWTPKLQREGDESIMQRFVGIEGVTEGQLRKANLVRQYL